MDQEPEAIVVRRVPGNLGECGQSQPCEALRLSPLVRRHYSRRAPVLTGPAKPYPMQQAGLPDKTFDMVRISGCTSKSMPASPARCSGSRPSRRSCTTTRYDRARQNLDRQASCVVTAFYSRSTLTLPTALEVAIPYQGRAALNGLIPSGPVGVGWTTDLVESSATVDRYGRRSECGVVTPYPVPPISVRPPTRSVRLSAGAACRTGRRPAWFRRCRQTPTGRGADPA